MNVVDSSGWLEYFADGANADYFAPAILDFEHLLVPTISVFEVFKKMRQERGEEAALEAVAQMQRGQLVLLDAPLAVVAAETSLIQKTANGRCHHADHRASQQRHLLDAG